MYGKSRFGGIFIFLRGYWKLKKNAYFCTLFMNKNNQATLADLIVAGIQERKGRKITHIDLSGIESSPAMDFFVCEGTSATHVAAVADSVRDYLLEQAGIKPYNYDGYGTSQWIVLDYGSALVHIFVPDERRRYNLEELWSDGVINEIPDLD